MYSTSDIDKFKEKKTKAEKTRDSYPSETRIHHYYDGVADTWDEIIKQAEKENASRFIYVNLVDGKCSCLQCREHDAELAIWLDKGTKVEFPRVEGIKHETILH